MNRFNIIYSQLASQIVDYFQSFVQRITEAFEQLQIPWEQDMEEKFVGYMEGILEWNEKINLTALFCSGALPTLSKKAFASFG